MLKELCEMPGVSGDEDRVRQHIRRSIESKVDEIVEDPYGNLIARKGSTRGSRILLAAHMDEVGLMITGIEKSGLLRFYAIGIMPHVLLAKRVLIGEKRVCGVIGHKPVHLTKDEEMKKIPDAKGLFIDIGAASSEAAAKLVTVGDYATFDTDFRENGDLIGGKAFDNRIGCHILMRLIEFDLPLYYAFTVQEEVGLRGAGIVAYRVKPDIAFAIDTTSSGEWPEERDVPQYPIIGKGPTITVADRRVICDPKILQTLRTTAEAERIPYQIKRPMVGGTDAGTMHLVREGVRCGVVAVPARYIHSPMAIASKKDIAAAVKLIDRSIRRMMRKD
ncbi:MAG: M42 family metallopeptidase [candidate division WOR-3 bacterium]|jgi:endoglucanase